MRGKNLKVDHAVVSIVEDGNGAEEFTLYFYYCIKINQLFDECLF